MRLWFTDSNPLDRIIFEAHVAGMRKPYKARTRLLFITDAIRGLEEGKQILIRGAASGSVKSIVCRWKATNPKIRMRTRKAIEGVIVERFKNAHRKQRPQHELV